MELPSSPRIDGGIANEMRRRKLAEDRLKSVAISGLLGVVALGAMIWMGDQGEPGQGRSQGASSLSTARSAALKRISIAHGQKLALTGLDGNSSDAQIGGEVAGGTSSNNTGTCAPIPARPVFFVNQVFWSWEHQLVVSASESTDVADKGSVINLGTIRSEPFSFTSQQTWTGPDGKLVAMSKQDAITTVTNVFVEDCDHRPIATISEAFAPGNSAVTEYTIQNTDGDIIALSTFSKGFGTEVEINQQSTGKRLVTIFKGWGQVSDAWVAKFRPNMPETLSNDPRVIVMLLSAASSAGSWGLGGPLSIILNPLWLLLIFCCCCACCTAFSRSRESRGDGYNEIPGGLGGGGFPGQFPGQGQSTGYGTGTYGRTEYV